MRRLLRDHRFRAVCLALWAAGWCVVAYQSLRPLQELPLGLSDKGLHLAGYAAMSALAAGFCHVPSRLALLAAGSVAAGALLEGAQYLLPYRSFELLDMAANTTGALLGTAVALLWVRLLVSPGRPAGSVAASPRPS